MSVTAAVIAIGAHLAKYAGAYMAASAVVSAGSAVYSAQERKKAAAYTAKSAEEAGEESTAMANLEAERHRDKIRRLKSSQIASYAKSGVKMEGSPLEVLADTAAQADLDEMIIKHGGQAESSAYGAQAMLSHMKGRSASTAGYINAGSSLLSGAYNISSSYNTKPKTKTVA